MNERPRNGEIIITIVKKIYNCKVTEDDDEIIQNFLWNLDAPTYRPMTNDPLTLRLQYDRL